LHDGATLVLKKLEKDYDPCNIFDAYRVIEEADRNRWLLTGIFYIEPDAQTLFDNHNLVDTPLNRLTSTALRPGVETLEQVMEEFAR